MGKRETVEQDEEHVSSHSGQGWPLSHPDPALLTAIIVQIGENILRLCLQELFQFRFMQTDPNWANFLYDANADKITLIDFGASREYTKEFMDGWYRLLNAALRGDRQTMKDESENLGYLTGEENEVRIMRWNSSPRGSG